MYHLKAPHRSWIPAPRFERYEHYTRNPVFPLSSGRRPGLNFAVGQAYSECRGRISLQVWIVPEGGGGVMVYRRDLDTLTGPAAWAGSRRLSIFPSMRANAWR
jgi:hypothetical protein